MLAHLARLGVVVVGLGIVLAWGCSQESPKKESPAGSAGPSAKQGEPAGKSATPPAETKPAAEKPEKPASETKPVQQEPEKPAATEPTPEAKPDEKTPENPEEPAAAPDSTEGRTGKAVGRVLKRLMEEKPDGPRGGASVRPPMRIIPPRINPEEAGKKAMEQYDADRDGIVKGDELEKAPSLKAALKQLDENNDGGVSANEVAARIKSWQDSKVARMVVSCTVTLNGKPFAGATVTFDPEKSLGTEIKACTGTTGSNGMASLSVPIPPGSDEPGGAACGLYLVRVSKMEGGRETIPATYNTQTVLGKEIALDATEMQEGTLHIDLKVP